MGCRLENAKYFFLDIKPKGMKNAKKQFPQMIEYGRWFAFFSAFGNIDLYNNKKTIFLTLFPTNQKFEWKNTKFGFLINCRLFTFYQSHII